MQHHMIKKQGWDKYCPDCKFQWKMPDNAGTANTPKITEVANTGTYSTPSRMVRFFSCFAWIFHIFPVRKTRMNFA